jgi:hypothetical protein
VTVRAAGIFDKVSNAGMSGDVWHGWLPVSKESWVGYVNLLIPLSLWTNKKMGDSLIETSPRPGRALPA